MRYTVIRTRLVWREKVLGTFKSVDDAIAAATAELQSWGVEDPKRRKNSQPLRNPEFAYCEVYKHHIGGALPPKPLFYVS